MTGEGVNLVRMRELLAATAWGKFPHEEVTVIAAAHQVGILWRVMEIKTFPGKAN